MKKIIISISCIAMISLASCKQDNKSQATEIANDCLQDKITKEIYGDKTEDFCNCLKQEIEMISDTITDQEGAIAKIKQDCADKYTSLDTEF